MLEEKILNVMGVDLEKMNFSLAGCGYLGIYHVGVGSCMRRFCPQIMRNKLSGASVGALVAAAFLCEVPLEQCTMSVINVVLQVRHGILGPITPDLDIMTLLYENMACILPEDAHLYCNGKLHVSVTRYEDCKNVLLNQFESKEDLLQALMCSCFIPVYCGFEPPKFHGICYVDGGYSSNCPKLDAHTITVAPFYGDTDICPQDTKGDFRTLMLNGTSIFLTMENCRRLMRVLFPGPPNMMKELCQKGYNDALRFLRKNGLIQCPDCLPNVDANGFLERTDHSKCKPIEYPMPIEISNEIDAAVQRLHQGIGQRLLRNPILKILYYVNMPGIFTAKVSYSFLSAIARKLQTKTGFYLDNTLSLPSRTTTKYVCHMGSEHINQTAIDVEQSKTLNGHTAQSPSALEGDNIAVALDIEKSSKNLFYTNDSNSIMHMTLTTTDESIPYKDLFHESSHSIELENERIKVPNYFVVDCQEAYAERV